MTISSSLDNWADLIVGRESEANRIHVPSFPYQHAAGQCTNRIYGEICLRKEPSSFTLGLPGRDLSEANAVHQTELVDWRWHSITPAEPPQSRNNGHRLFRAIRPRRGSCGQPETPIIKSSPALNCFNREIQPMESSV